MSFSTQIYTKIAENKSVNKSQSGPSFAEIFSKKLATPRENPVFPSEKCHKKSNSEVFSQWMDAIKWVPQAARSRSKSQVSRAKTAFSNGMGTKNSHVTETSQRPISPMTPEEKEALLFFKMLGIQGLGQAPTEDDLKKAYRSAVHLLHPDAHPDSSETFKRSLAKQFIAMKDHYQTLTQWLQHTRNSDLKQTPKSA